MELLEQKPMPLTDHKKDIIIEQLRKQGLRITEQRKLLINIILENECSSCKEIYYEAIKYDSSVGIATVYRMVKVLEDYKLIDRKNLYTIDYKNLDLENKEKVIFVDDKTEEVTEIKKGQWFELLQAALKDQGFTELDNISVVIKHNNKDTQSSCDEEMAKQCKCTNINCKYHCKNPVRRLA